MTASEIVVDGRGLVPPEPMEKVLAALDALEPGQRVRFLIHRQPYPLYDILRRYHYRFVTGSHAAAWELDQKGLTSWFEKEVESKEFGQNLGISGDRQRRGLLRGEDGRIIKCHIAAALGDFNAGNRAG